MIKSTQNLRLLSIGGRTHERISIEGQTQERIATNDNNTNENMYSRLMVSDSDMQCPTGNKIVTNPNCKLALQCG